MQIVDVLDAGRNPHQAVGDAERRAPLGGHRRVRHRRRMRDERFDAAEALGERHQPDAVQQRRARLERSEIEREHAAEAAHLPLRQRVLRMRRQPGIVDLAAPSGAPARNSREREAVGVVLLPSGAAASWCRAAPATNRTGSGSRRRRSARTAATRCRRRASRSTTPPTLSLWPFRYFVVLWTTRSAPNSIGRCRTRARERVVDDEPRVVAVRELGRGARDR